MTVEDVMRRYDEAMEPVRQALDRAVAAGVDPESIEEGVQIHLQWWRDELAARTETR